ncbi:glycosyltransferase family 69 protein [Thermothielavioides terrestris NRRL 8126]|uniref:Glycosyltransferase family 69 protein n=1 Tax=Thermothielavioides terrestris (strain ATCC 38088 / NRRL 8126) TaxID=578455 RepID=G2RBC1_THETT|nr:glycosyltransferase family 69 protein [Thermothielavioides terrestris NRRL 8126]AEO69092.1 glycosyltransferase family 69 protein [Thermothielavioides terrestris NRRL 8126]
MLSSRRQSSSDLDGDQFGKPAVSLSLLEHRSGTGPESLDNVILPRRASPGRWRCTIVSWAARRLRLSRRGLLVCFKYLAPVIAAVLVLVPIFAPSYLHPPAHYRELEARCRGDAAEPGCANPSNEKVFIAISLYDRGGHLAGGPWGKALLNLIHLIGPSNAYLSIYENDSGPEAAAALEELQRQVPCNHSIVNDPHVDMRLIPNVTMPDGTQRTKRIAYLSEVRNRALRPLDRVGGEHDGIVPFDKILFLNDIAFRPVDAAHLLFSTNIGPDGRTRYLSACALDYRTMFLFYDLYAQRDADGYSNGLPFYPIFTGAGRGLSRADMRRQTDAVRVRSCWGGMVAMQARYVQHLGRELPRPDFQQIGAHVIDPARPRNVSAPVRFRHEPDLFVDACECCLFLADVAQVARRAVGAPDDGDTNTDLAESTATLVNPYVRVAYDWGVLARERVARRWERLLGVVHAVVTPLVGLPRHNPYRAVREGEPFVEEVWSSERQRWELERRVGRNGLFCLVRQFQTITPGERQGDQNWEDNDIPPGQTLDFPT